MIKRLPGSVLKEKSQALFHLWLLPAGCWAAEVMAGAWGTILDHEINLCSEDGGKTTWKKPRSLTLCEIAWTALGCVTAASFTEKYTPIVSKPLLFRIFCHSLPNWILTGKGVKAEQFHSKLLGCGWLWLWLWLVWVIFLSPSNFPWALLLFLFLIPCSRCQGKLTRALFGNRGLSTPAVEGGVSK